MKSALCFLSLVLMLTAGQAQVIQLEEARVSGPQTVKVSSNLNGFEMSLKEEFKGQFSKDPIGFMKKNFDIHAFIVNHSGENIDTYEVNFQSSKGNLLAVFDKKGDLLRTTQRFSNLPLPMEMRKHLLTDYKEWTMKKNVFVAYGDKDRIDNQYYKITLKNGNKTQRIKINQITDTRLRLALHQ